MNRLLAELRETQAAGVDVISLLRGEPDFPTPAGIVAAAEQSLRAGRTQYPNNQGDPELRRAVAERLSVDHGLQYSPEREVLITDGATLGFAAAVAALLNPGDSALVPEPCYDAYLPALRLMGVEPIAVPGEYVEGRFQLSPAQVAGRIRPGTRALVLNSPWNPAGTVFTRSELAGLVSVAEAANLWILSDEIYEAVTYGGEVVSTAAVSPAARERTVILNSFSKTYAMTGWRLGFCAGPEAAIRAMLLSLQQSSRGPALFVQDAGTAALRGPRTDVDAMRQEYARRRARVVESLQAIPGVRCPPPEGGFFALVDVRGISTDDEAIRRSLLREDGVAVAPGSAYGPAAAGFLRVSFAAGGDALDRGLDRLAAGLTRVGSAPR